MSLALLADALSAPLTFSQTTSPGLITAIASLMATHRFERVPSFIPARRPAADKSWQGVPPQSTSTGVTSFQSSAVMSPMFGASWNRCSRILHAPGSMSDTHTVFPPVTSSTARSSPPYPEQNEPIRGRSSSIRRVIDCGSSSCSVMPHPAFVLVRIRDGVRAGGFRDRRRSVRTCS